MSILKRYYCYMMKLEFKTRTSTRRTSEWLKCQSFDFWAFFHCEVQWEATHKTRTLDQIFTWHPPRTDMSWKLVLICSWWCHCHSRMCQFSTFNPGFYLSTWVPFQIAWEKKPAGTVVSVMPLNMSRVKWTEHHILLEWQNERSLWKNISQC